MGSTGRHIRQIYRIWGIYSQKALKNTDLSISEIEALKIISHHKDISQQGLACHLGIDKAAVTRLAASLEEKKYIYRLADESDKRVKRLYPTDIANEIREEIKVLEHDFYNCIQEGLDEAELEAFNTVLEKMARKAKEERLNGFSDILI